MFTISGGEIQTAKISRGEPVWSVNFKKALALQLQTKLDKQLQDTPVSSDDLQLVESCKSTLNKHEKMTTNPIVYILHRK